MVKNLSIGTRSKKELVLTKTDVKLLKKPAVNYPTDTDNIKIKDIQKVRVSEMDLSVGFAFNWIGIELALLLIFFGLTSASIPLYNVWMALVGYPAFNFNLHFARVLVSMIMIWVGIVLVPWFDAVGITIIAKDGSIIRYLRNIRFRNELEIFKQELINRTKKKKTKKKKRK